MDDNIDHGKLTVAEYKEILDALYAGIESRIDSTERDYEFSPTESKLAKLQTLVDLRKFYNSLYQGQRKIAL